MQPPHSRDKFYPLGCVSSARLRAAPLGACVPAFPPACLPACLPLQLAGQLRSLHKLPVGYVALDWHQMDKELGSEALVEAFWTQLSALLPPQVSFESDV